MSRLKTSDATVSGARVKRQETAFFNYFAPEATETLNDLTR
jgi:hypothetical protein